MEKIGRKSMRTGIYGGSFNPIHNGHIRNAESAAKELGLDRVFFVPSRISPHRSSEDYVSGEDRLEMVRLACEDRDDFIPCDFELRQDGVSYSIYTVEYFRRRFPDDELFLIVGSDMLMSFDKWYRFEDILGEVTLCASTRSGDDLGELRRKAHDLGRYGRVIVTGSCPIVVSSTEIRKKIAKNEDFTCYLNENVVQYIRLRKLYT